MPGVYADGQGGLHLVLDELLSGHGYADTPDNRATLIAAVRAQFRPTILTITEVLECDE